MATDKSQIPDSNEEQAEAPKQEIKKKAAIPVQHYYDVKVECMLPAILTYRVLAESPQQAAELIKGKSPTGVKHQLVGRKELMLKVYDASGCMIRFMKRLMG